MCVCAVMRNGMRFTRSRIGGELAELDDIILGRMMHKHKQEGMGGRLLQVIEM